MAEDWVRCSRCGKRVSNIVGDGGDLVVRAWVECPECIERGGALADLRATITEGLVLADRLEAEQRARPFDVDNNGRPILLDVLVARSNLLLAQAIIEGRDG